MIKLFIVLSLLLESQYVWCVVDVVCEQYRNSYGAADPNFCVIDRFAQSTSNESNAYNFRSDLDKQLVKSIAFFDETTSLNVGTFPGGIFSTFPNVGHLTMQRVNVSELNSDSFVNAMNLWSLDLRLNKIKAIRSGVFSIAAVRAQSAQQHTDIEKVTFDDVYPLHVLWKLILNGNEIEEIDNYAFYGLRALFRIYMDDNRLTIIRRHTFTGLNRLIELSLENNQISTIEEHAFDFPNIRTIFLQNNPLKTLSNNIVRRGSPAIALDENQMKELNRTIN
ncbi:toll-like receptor 7 [Bradysia coprophila]|uniref:toll-like receptor 7 n=1 Tax=Bradysia coprophila TaxID=38358 RepID=UPI00187D8305|nr:toll-like receptor 7 [Bradysia coprophila]